MISLAVELFGLAIVLVYVGLALLFIFNGGFK